MALEYEGNKKEVVYSAQLNNLAFANLNSVLTGCEVTPSSPAAMTVDVDSGTIFFGNDKISVSASVGTLTIDTEATANTRKDLILVNASGTLSVLKGTASAIPATPDYDPETYIVLAIITIVNTTTTITSNEIKDIRILNQGGAGGAGGSFDRYVEDFTSQTSVTVIHNLGDDEPNVFVYDNTNVLISPASVTANNKNAVTVTFSVATSGRIIVYGGLGVNNAYYAEDYSSSTTWNVAHNLNNKYVNVTCFDTSDNIIEPQNINVTDENNLVITFAVATAGKAVITGGIATSPSNAIGVPYLNYGNVDIGTSATLIKAANIDRKGILIRNYGSISIYIGDNAVTTSNGYELEAGKCIYLKDTEAIYAVASTGTVDTRYMEATQ